MKTPKLYEPTIEQGRQDSQSQIHRKIRSRSKVTYYPDPGMEILIGQTSNAVDVSYFHQDYTLGLSKHGDGYLLLGKFDQSQIGGRHSRWQFIRRATGQDVSAFVAVSMQEGVISTHLGKACKPVYLEDPSLAGMSPGMSPYGFLPKLTRTTRTV